MNNFSSPMSNPWFGAIDDVDDLTMLQKFLDDCPVDNPPQEMGPLVYGDELQLTSTTTTVEISNNIDINNRKSNAESNQNNKHSSVQQHHSLSPDETDIRPEITTDATIKPTKRRPKRLAEQTHNHIIAERQRRQILSQRFIALSALIPDLKKTDKTSILGEAIAYMKELKERIKSLEDERAARVEKPRVVLVVDNNEKRDVSMTTTTSDNSSSHGREEFVPEVEVRFSNKSVLIKIHCRPQTGFFSKIISRIESLKLMVTNTCSMSFNNATLHITIMTQMEPNFEMGCEEVVENLRSMS